MSHTDINDPLGYRCGVSVGAHRIHFSHGQDPQGLVSLRVHVPVVMDNLAFQGVRPRSADFGPWNLWEICRWEVSDFGVATTAAVVQYSRRLACNYINATRAVPFQMSQPEPMWHLTRNLSNGKACHTIPCHVDSEGCKS